MENKTYVASNLNGKLVLNALLWMTFGVICMCGFLIGVLALLPAIDGEEGALMTSILCILLGFGTLYPAARSIKKMAYVRFAQYAGEIFEKETSPLLSIEDFRKKLDKKMESMSRGSGYNLYEKYDMVKYISTAIKYNYLRNCTIEIHDGVAYIAMAKKVAKGKCPHCGAPIVGVYSDNYVCKYCGSSINNVLEKK